MLGKMLLAGSLIALTGLSAAHAQDAKELNFGIISTETTQNLKTEWEPFLADMEKSTGLKIHGFFASDYAGVIEAMRFDKVQVAWYGNKSAMEAVDRASGEVFAQKTYADGTKGYYSLIIVHKDSAIQTLDDLLKHAKDYNFGNGDPNSTSGFLVPGYYVFAKNNLDPKSAFKRMITSNHETNLLAVANRQVDAATNNTEDLEKFGKLNPEKAALIHVIWKSPLIPADPIVWRKDLAPETKEKVKSFLVTYGTERAGADLAHERKVLADLGGWGGFVASSDAQLIPIRQIELYRQRTKLVNDTSVTEADKKKQLDEIDAKLADLSKQAGS